MLETMFIRSVSDKQTKKKEREKKENEPQTPTI